jgi:2-keto-4-pentenoate hydratase/2-oxohepta-3-ene-1,7-dioic acid hydratase in catechol pathway
MKIATYQTDGPPQLGAIVDDRMHAFADIAPRLPPNMEALLEAGPAALDAAREALAQAKGGRALDTVKLCAPVRRPRKFLGIGFNYQSHVDEVRKKGLPIPDLSNQIWFNKQTSCIIGPYDPMHLPSVSEQFDYEVELGLVIGRRCRHVTPADARKVIAGYMIVNDASIRDWQLKAPTATLGKSFDTHGPTGPWLTTADEIANPERLRVRTLVDGVVMQDGNTEELVNGIDAMIAYLTKVMTLEPGDIIATGTPHGVAAGRTPQAWLHVGQVVRCEIEGLGYIENPIIAEPLEATTFIE